MIGRFWLGLLLCLAGFWIGVVRGIGAGFGNPLVVDGGTLLVLGLLGVGIYLIATAVDAAKREDREAQDREQER